MFVRRRSEESGGVAVFTALMAVLMLALAAISVDLGNAWARGRVVQKQADVTALSVGNLLPMTSTNVGGIATETASYLNRNLVPGQSLVQASQLRNGDLDDGELIFQDAEGNACVSSCPRMTLESPRAQVDLGFAAVLGVSGTTVQRAATVQASEARPDMTKVLPFLLPNGCGYGPTEIKAGAGKAGGLSCAGSERGNFGYMDSPRGDVNGNALDVNIALGLDHEVIPFEWEAQTPVPMCARGNGNDRMAGAELDDKPARDGRNCIKAESGNVVSALKQGLIEGTKGNPKHPGRLQASQGPTTPGCGRSDVSHSGHLLNNDVLSCFLRNGAKLEHITADTGVDPSMLDPRVMESPRFIWLPVVLAEGRDSKDFQPVMEFVAAFITDQTFTSPATSKNGVDGDSVQAFIFNKAALPGFQDPEAGGGATSGNGLVHLVG